MINRDQRSFAHSMAFAVAKAVAVTLAFLAGHVAVSVAADPYGVAEPVPAPAVEIEQTILFQPTP